MVCRVVSVLQSAEKLTLDSLWESCEIIQKFGLLPPVLDSRFHLWFKSFLGLLREIFTSKIVFVWLWAVVCLFAMPLPAPDVPASQRLAMDCRTLLDHRIGKGKWQQHLFCSHSGCFAAYKLCKQGFIVTEIWLLEYLYFLKNSPRNGSLIFVFALWAASFFRKIDLAAALGQSTIKRVTGCDLYLAEFLWISVDQRNFFQGILLLCLAKFFTNSKSLSNVVIFWKQQMFILLSEREA